MKRAGLPLVAVIAALAAAYFLYAALAPGLGAARTKASEASYRLEFSPDFKPLLASRDDLGISVVIAVDVSGSMADPPASGGKPKYLQAASALGRVVDTLERIAASAPEGQAIKVGLLKFNKDVSPLLPLTLLDRQGIARLRGILASPVALSPGGSTAIGDALGRAAEWLSQSGTILRSAIVITDGENVEGADPSWVLSAIYGNRNSASTPDYPVATNSILVSFIGFDIDAGRFAPLAAYGARVTSAEDQAELVRVLGRLLEADITRLEAPGLDSPGAGRAP